MDAGEITASASFAAKISPLSASISTAWLLGISSPSSAVAAVASGTKRSSCGSFGCCTTALPTAGTSPASLLVPFSRCPNPDRSTTAITPAARKGASSSICRRRRARNRSRRALSRRARRAARSSSVIAVVSFRSMCAPALLSMHHPCMRFFYMGCIIPKSAQKYSTCGKDFKKAAAGRACQGEKKTAPGRSGPLHRFVVQAIRFSSSVRMMNTAPIHLVALAILASAVFASCLLIKESATPAMEPDRPALLPDCIMMMPISSKPQITWITVRKMVIVSSSRYRYSKSNGR